MIGGKAGFLRLCHEELFREKERDGIGLLAEKRLHSVLKRWICDDFSCHEVRVFDKDGKKSRFVADVLTEDGEIFEVQTGKLYPMRKKLAFYMESTAHSVTVVHPLLAQKYITWIGEGGEVTPRKRSPQHQTALWGIAELKPYLSYLGDPRFSLLLPLIEVEEFRLLDGWGKGGKRGSHRYELMPLSLFDVCHLKTTEDYAALFPQDPLLSTPFTAKSFGKQTGLRGYALYDVLAVFEGLGVIEKCGKEKRAALYRKCKQKTLTNRSSLPGIT